MQSLVESPQALLQSCWSFVLDVPKPEPYPSQPLNFNLQGVAQEWIGQWMTATQTRPLVHRYLDTSSNRHGAGATHH